MEISQAKQPSIITKETKSNYFQELAGSINIEQAASDLRVKTEMQNNV